jgi:hypothetical protein
MVRASCLAEQGSIPPPPAPCFSQLPQQPSLQRLRLTCCDGGGLALSRERSSRGALRHLLIHEPRPARMLSGRCGVAKPGGRAAFTHCSVRPRPAADPPIAGFKIQEEAREPPITPQTASLSSHLEPVPQPRCLSRLGRQPCLEARDLVPRRGSQRRGCGVAALDFVLELARLGAPPRGGGGAVGGLGAERGGLLLGVPPELRFSRDAKSGSAGLQSQRGLADRNGLTIPRRLEMLNAAMAKAARLVGHLARSDPKWCAPAASGSLWHPARPGRRGASGGGWGV